VRVPHDLTAFVSKHPLQLLLVEALQRPIESTTYASEDYQAELEAHGIICSMSRRGNCYDNAAMESWFSTLKSELAEDFESYGIAKAELFDYIEVFYNQQRLHSSLDYATPAEHERNAQQQQLAAA
jgi:putative transposase